MAFALLLMIKEPVAKLLTALMARTWTVYVVGFFTHSNGYGFQYPPNIPFQSIPCLHVLSFATGSLRLACIAYQQAVTRNQASYSTKILNSCHRDGYSYQKTSHAITSFQQITRK
jgi:hypothetical protein